MDDAPAEDRRLLLILDDAARATFWVAVAVFAAMLASYLIFLALRFTVPGAIAWMWGVDEALMPTLYIGALGLMKLMAFWFAAVALGLHLWKRRLERRIAQGSDES